MKSISCRSSLDKIVRLSLLAWLMFSTTAGSAGVVMSLPPSQDAWTTLLNDPPKDAPGDCGWDLWCAEPGTRCSHFEIDRLDSSKCIYYEGKCDRELLIRCFCGGPVGKAKEVDMKYCD